ncbi:MAG: substrate-binding domain-containing protein [Candidatus Latescibacteria bacterium]|nr:substrate-binding domain-containing protein [Candidatus Latescibacterota bacterium]
MNNKLGALALVLGLAAGAVAEEWHGFDPAGFGGLMLKAEALQAMAAEARQHRPPKNGDHYVFAFANLQRDMAFGIKVEEGIKANAASAGLELLVADNRLDGPTALANAESFVRRGVDLVIEFQTDVNFGPTIMQKFTRAGIGVVAIDIPMPGATFFGANNPRSGFMGGSYLAQAALARFGDEQVARGYQVVGELPQSGAIPAMRTEGQVAGFLAMLPDFPAAQLIRIDTKNTLQYSFQQMRNVLSRIPPGAPLMLLAINDQSVTGMLRAVQQAGRQGDLIAVGNGADELETLAKEAPLVASVAYFPERYGNYLIPLGLMSLAGRPLPPAVLVEHLMVTRANVCQYYPDFPCQEQGPGFAYVFPQEAFARHLARLKGKPELAGYQTLIPAR